MKSFTKALTLSTVGWALYLVALAVVLVTDHGEVGYVTVAAVLAAGMLAWTRRGGGRASFIVSLVLGVLLAAQSVAYVVADVSTSPLDARVLILDIVTLVAGVAIVVGSAWAVRSRRRESVVAIV